MAKSDSGTDWQRREAESVVRALDSSAAAGLSNAEAAARLEATGPNEIDSDRAASLLTLLAHQLADFMIGLLIVAAIISGLVGDIIDTIAILVIVIANAAVGVFQEYRAERAVAALREMSAPEARVMRDGKPATVAARDLVPGDIVMLEAGDVVPADLRLLEAIDVGVDESALTGESVPVAKHVDVVDTDGSQIAECFNMAFKSTLVTRGRTTGIAVATGRVTEIGRIADLMRGHGAGKTPLQTRLALFSRRIAIAVVAICAVVFATGVMQGQPLLLMFMTALSLAVAAVPEALPAVITVALGLGARRLGELKALVRRLPAVESLGSVTYICADKTGTLTENRMRVGVLHVDGTRYETLTELPAAVLERIGPVLALCNDVRHDHDGAHGDPTELALIHAARDAGFEKAALEADLPRVDELPFESARQCMATVHESPGGRMVLVKGAPERIIPAAAGAGEDDLATAEALAEQGFRVLALAFNERPGEDLERGWSYLGLVGLVDPPRAGVAEAIAECRSAGIVPVMITGDHPATARAIAARLDITDDPSAAITGAELSRLSDAELERRVESLRVYARVDPEQKIRIVEALQQKGNFVAMTGDGVNDAPALKAATIGIAMGERGTDVAREAAELVLLDDSFATIVAAVEEGRRVFDDIRKFIRYTMTSNSGEIWVLLLAPFLGLPIPLLPLHILWINLVTDGLPGLALSAEPAERDVMQRPPRPMGEGIFTTAMVNHILGVGIAIAGITLVTQAWALRADLPEWQTMVFTVLVFAQLFHSLAIRSERYSLLSIGLFSNPMLLFAVCVTVAAQLMVIYVPALNAIFHTAPLSLNQLAICFGAGAVILLIVEIEKLVRRQSI
jgi:Ca2+-transporting ATPase